jgi:hypothetical protein
VAGTVTLRAHLAALRKADERWQAERDRRYTEVGVEREKALRIKETADLAALQLAREIQTYKDQAHNGLLQQIDRERARYPTKDDLAAAIEKVEATVKPLAEYVSGAQGRSGGEADSRTERRLDTGQLVAIVSVVLVAVSIAVAVILGTRPG